MDSTNDAASEPPTTVVGVGAPPDPDALARFVAAVPADAGLAVVVVARGRADFDALVTRLDGCARVPVVRAETGAPLCGGTMYVVPPGERVVVTDGRIQASAPPQGDAAPDPVESLLDSLAGAFGRRAVGVALVGSGAETALRPIKRAGGLSIAEQGGGTTEYPALGVADVVVPVADIPVVLARFAELPDDPDADADATGGSTADVSERQLHQLASILEQGTGVFLRSYKTTTVLRRFTRRVRLAGFGDVDHYLEHLKESAPEQRQLARELMIRVTDFFRDPESFEALRERAVDELVRAAPHGDVLRAWVPACSTGEEAYSVAMLLLEAAQEARRDDLDAQVFATDISGDALAIARRGVYPASIAEHMPEDRLRAFFTTRDAHELEVKSRLRDTVCFALHDVCTDPPFSRMDLVCCRNLLIYLQPRSEDKVLHALHFALRPSGILFLGSSESAGSQADLFTAVSKTHRIYRKVGASRPVLTRRSVAARQRIAADEYADVYRPGGAIRREPDSEELARLDLLDTLPAAVVVSAEGYVLFSHGDLSRYLTLPQGAPNLEFVAMVRGKGLSNRVRGALYRSRREGEVVSSVYGPSEAGAYTRITVRPARHLGADASVVIFESARGADRAAVGEVLNGEQQALVEQLERELSATREDLRNTVEELETSNEELRASNEEATSMNEELQATNEELEATTEELRSVNEELSTVNASLKGKVEEVQRSHDDLANFFASTKLATLFLDAHGRIRRFTPAAARLLHLTSGDEGRRAVDIARDLLQRGLQDDVLAVLEQLSPHSREIHLDDGRWFERQVLPYRTEGQQILGVVVTLVDTTETRAAAEALAARERQQAVIARLGLAALERTDVQAFMEQVVREVQQVLDTDYCKILELTPARDRLLLRAGVGWAEGLVGHGTVGAGLDSQAGYTLAVSEPVIVDELEADRRFSGPPLLHDHGVTSGVSCTIQQGGVPYGVIGAHTRRRRRFTKEDADFLQSVANVLAQGIAAAMTRQRLAIEHAVMRVLAEAEGLDDAAPRIVEAFSQEIGADVGELWTPVAGGERLERTAFVAADKGREAELANRFPTTSFGEGEGLVGRVWRDRRVEWLVLATEANRFERADAARGVGLRRGLAVPIRAGDNVIAVIALLSGGDIVVDQNFLRSVEALGRVVGEFVIRREVERQAAGLAAIVESSDDAILSKDPDGIVTSWNRGAERLYGYSAREVIGRSISLIFPPGAEHELESILARLRRRQPIDHYETVRQTKSGELIDVSVTISPVVGRDGVMVGSSAVGRDITARKRADAELAEARRWFVRLSEVTPEVVTVYDVVDDRSIYANRSMVDELGYRASDLQKLGTGLIAQLLHPDDLEAFRRIVGGMRDSDPDEVREIVYRIRHRDGMYRWRSARFVPFERDADGRVRQVLAVSTDITERKRAEEELRDSQEQLRRASEQKDQFLAMLGHELRNPLAAIRNAAELLKKTRVEDRRLARTQAILDRQSKHMARLLDGLLDVSRMVRGKISIERSILDLAALVREVVDDGRHNFESVGLDLETNIPREPVWVVGDAVRLAQVADNLLSNAIKFTERGGTIRVEVAGDEAGTTATLTVQDTGCGIDPNLLATVFEPFQQASVQPGAGSAGLGLGLALVKGITDLHGGAVEADSTGPGAGARFRVRLPASGPPAEIVDRAETAGEPRRILIVEDNADSAAVLRDVLETSGHRVALAENAGDALRAARSIAPEVILSDIGLPGGMSGLELARAVRGDPDLREVFLVALTGYGRPDDRRRAREAGFDVHVTKPVDVDVLERLLQQVHVSQVDEVDLDQGAGRG